MGTDRDRLDGRRVPPMLPESTDLTRVYTHSHSVLFLSLEKCIRNFFVRELKVLCICVVDAGAHG